MKRIIFYSWQSDLPNSSNRGFIQESLESAALAIKADDAIAVEPVVDRDTQGVPGAPDIASTIFAKISGADVFVADVSIIDRNQNRATPNPNVLIELGYAFKALGAERIVLVFNRAFGKIEELPFDLRMRRVLAYEMPATGTPKGPERKILEKQLDSAIRSALQHREASADPSPIPALVAIENQVPNRIIVLRRNVEGILGRLDALQPKKHSAGGTIDDLLKGLDSTQETVAEFTKISEVIALMNDDGAALEVLRWFGSVFERYNKPEVFSGRSSNADEDYFKFIGHELFVTFIAVLIREQRWGILQGVLTRPIPMKYVPHQHGPGNVDWRYASEHLPSVLDESSRRRRISLHADILNERHTTGGLGAVMPMDDFMGGDYFLYLFAEMTIDDWSGPRFDWRPWSVIYLKQVPLFLHSAESKQIADELVKVFGLVDIGEFRRRLAERAPHLRKLFGGGFWTDPFRNYESARFGTR
jgi:hypothetical protein